MFASKLFVPSTTTTSIALFLRRSTNLKVTTSSLRSFSTEPTTIQEDSMTPESLLSHFSDGDKLLKGNSVKNAMYSLFTADAVCFDVDSTVIAEEGIDVLAEYLGKGSEVADLTKRAMDGNTKFEDALEARLELMKPSKQSILNCLKENPLQLSPGIDNLMSSLQSKNIDIWLVSGGFRIMIEPVADMLQIPITNIVANTIQFDSEGNYVGFDDTEPTSRDMGKPKALTQIMEQNPSSKYQTLVMVGDGATDAQAKPPASAFIGYGGVITREAVVEKADWFVTDFDDLIKIIQLRE